MFIELHPRLYTACLLCSVELRVWGLCFVRTGALRRRCPGCHGIYVSESMKLSALTEIEAALLLRGWSNDMFLAQHLG